MKASSVWMPFYIGDYLADTIGLSLGEHGAYLLSIFAYWRKGAPLTQQELKAICNSHCNRVCRFFVKVTGTNSVEGGPLWSHKRIDQEIKAAILVSSKQAARTEAARAALAEKHAPVTVSVTDSVTDSVTSSLSQSHLSPTKKLKGSDKVAKASAKRKLRPQEAAIAIRFELALNGQWRNDSGKWINRIVSEFRDAERVVAEVELAIKEDRIQSTPAQYAEQIWKEFTGGKKP